MINAGLWNTCNTLQNHGSRLLMPWIENLQTVHFDMCTLGRFTSQCYTDRNNIMYYARSNKCFEVFEMIWDTNIKVFWEH